MIIKQTKNPAVNGSRAGVETLFKNLIVFIIPKYSSKYKINMLVGGIYE